MKNKGDFSVDNQYSGNLIAVELFNDNKWQFISGETHRKKEESDEAASSA